MPTAEEPELLHVDAHVVVVRKPAGIASVPFPGDPATAREWTLVDLLARRLGGRAVRVVQRLDRETSGVLVFARTREAEERLRHQFRQHRVQRLYLALAHGAVRAATIRSLLAEDRGDGRRGSTHNARLGRLAITHVTPLAALRGATVVRCRLETGRTHQIRIHLAERGHPLVGERVYGGMPPAARIPAPRLMLHAALLGFVHPAREEPLCFLDPPPAAFLDLVARLGGDPGKIAGDLLEQP